MKQFLIKLKNLITKVVQILAPLVAIYRVVKEIIEQWKKHF